MRTESFRWLLLGFLIGSFVGAGAVSLLSSARVPSASVTTVSELPAAVPAPQPSTAGRIYFSGEVKAQGAIEISPQDHYTLSQAIVVNGGLADFADRRHVKILRTGAQPQIVDLAEIIDHGHWEKDPLLSPGDIIVVPKRLINY